MSASYIKLENCGPTPDWGCKLQYASRYEPTLRAELSKHELDLFERLKINNNLDKNCYLFNCVDETNWRERLYFSWDFIYEEHYSRLKSSYEKRNIPVSGIQGIWLFREQSFQNKKIVDRVNARLYKDINDDWLAIISHEDYREAGYSTYTKRYKCHKLEGLMDLLSYLIW